MRDKDDATRKILLITVDGNADVRTYIIIMGITNTSYIWNTIHTISIIVKSN